MMQTMKLKITEINGWSKTIDIEKAITRVGSAPFADIQLSSNLISPLHLQILSNPDLPTGCRVVNMAQPVMIENHGIPQPLATYMTYDVRHGDEIKLGEYLLTFDIPLVATLLRTAKNLEASIEFMDTLLQPDLPLEGVLMVKNSGEKDSCQFQVEVNGLPDECMHIDPIPMLYPGAQENVPLRLIHKTVVPPAGLTELLIKITAPESYPGEELIIKQGINVAPVFKQSIEIADDLQIQPEIKIEENLNAVTSPKVEEISAVNLPVEIPSPGESVVPEESFPSADVANASKPVEQPDLTSNSEKEIFSEETGTEKTDNNPPHDLDISKVKVVHTQTDEYWGDK